MEFNEWLRTEHSAFGGDTAALYASLGLEHDNANELILQAAYDALAPLCTGECMTISRASTWSRVQAVPLLTHCVRLRKLQSRRRRRRSCCTAPQRRTLPASFPCLLAVWFAAAIEASGQRALVGHGDCLLSQFSELTIADAAPRAPPGKKKQTQ